MNDAVALVPNRRVSLVEKFAAKYSIEPEKMMTTLKQTAFKVKDGDPPVTNEQMAALLIVADQYNLNPFVKEIFAFPDKSGGIVPVVGVDGWSRIINEHPQFDGMDFHFPDETDSVPAWIECAMHRKDRVHPIVVREYMVECKRNTIPWNSHPRRMLRHKAIIQAARVAFGYSGVYDEDEAERIVGSGVAQEGEVATAKPAQTTTERVKANLRQKEAATFENEPERRETIDAPEGEAVPQTVDAPQPSGKLTTQKAIEGLQECDKRDILVLYCEALPEAIKTNSKFQAAVLSRTRELEAAEKASLSGNKVSYDYLSNRFKNAKDVDVLEADADLIRYVELPADQDRLRDQYAAKREELLR
jgi:phage recombination protein Bet